MATALPFSTVTVAESCEILPQHNNADTGLYEHEAQQHCTVAERLHSRETFISLPTRCRKSLIYQVQQRRFSTLSPSNYLALTSELSSPSAK